MKLEVSGKMFYQDMPKYWCIGLVYSTRNVHQSMMNDLMTLMMIVVEMMMMMTVHVMVVQMMI